MLNRSYFKSNQVLIYCTPVASPYTSGQSDESDKCNKSNESNEGARVGMSENIWGIVEEGKFNYVEYAITVNIYRL